MERIIIFTVCISLVISYRKELIGVKIETVVVPVKTNSNFQLTGLDASKEYYLLFVAPCNFHGTIR